jgi:hypothetical protein
MGIVNHNDIIWQIAPTNREKSIKEKYIYFTLIKHTEELNIIGKRTALKQQQLEFEDNNINNELIALKEQTTNSFNNFIKTRELLQNKMDKENIYRKALNVWTDLNKFTDYKEGKQFKLSAFKKTSDKDGGNFIFYDMEQNLKLYANAQLNGFLNKCVNNNPEYYNDIKGDIYYLYRDASTQYTAVITIKDYELSNGKRKANLIIKPNPLIYKKEEEITQTHTYLNYRDEELLKQKTVKKTYINVKTLEQDKEYYIYAIHKVKDNYIFKMLDNDLKPIENQIYTGNYYINTNTDINNIYDHNVQTQPFKIKIGREKTTPTNNKAVYIYVVINEQTPE